MKGIMSAAADAVLNALERTLLAEIAKNNGKPIKWRKFVIGVFREGREG